MDVEKKHFTCVTCPIGCEIDVELQDSDVVSMEGTKCTKGKEFVSQELDEPMRILTTTIRIKGAKWAMLPVRTDRPIPKRLLFRVIEELTDIERRAPVKMSDVIVRDIADTGVNIVATRSMNREKKGKFV
jgi:CxxC motif-containing protein